MLEIDKAWKYYVDYNEGKIQMFIESECIYVFAHENVKLNKEIS